MKKHVLDTIDRLYRSIAWHLPHGLVMWCVVRVVAHAPQGQWSNQEVPKLTAMDALKRWDESP